MTEPFATATIAELSPDEVVVPLRPVDAADAGPREALQPGDPGLVRAYTGSRRMLRRGFFSDAADKWLFAFFAGLGIVAALVAGLWGFHGIRGELMPIAALLLYAFTSSRLEWFRLHPDRLGDNCYYMGFLFTLTALSAALMALQNQASEGRGEMLEGLIGSFGIALFSTIGGITLRVYFMQMRQEVEDIEQEIRNDLQEAARVLKDHLAEAVSDLESFRLRTQQVMEDQFNSKLSGFTATSEILSKHLAASGDAHVAATERLTVGSEQAAERLAAAAETMSEQVRTAGEIQGAIAEKLASNVERVVGEVSRLVERIDHIEVPSDLLTRQVDDARERVSALAAALEEAAIADAGRQEAVHQAASSLDKLLARLSGLAAFEHIETSARRLGPIVDSTGDAIASLGARMSGQAEAFGELVSQARADATAMSEARRTLQSDLSESTLALHKLQDTLAQVADSVVRRLGDA